jgi:predicted ferric reductase
MASHFWWYTARAGGLVAWGLVVASCVWGLLLALRVGGRRPGPAWHLSLHRYLSGLAIAFLGVHVAAILADSFVHFTLADTLIPFASSWHPLAVAWGIVAMYLLVAVEFTSLFRQMLSNAVWRGIHLTSYVVLVVSTIHLLTAGTDARDLLPETVAIGIGVGVVFGGGMLLTWRTAPKVRPVPVSRTQDHEGLPVA